MKPFLGIELTHDRKNQQVNGDALMVARPSAPIKQALDRSAEIASQTTQRSKLPLVWRILQFTCGALGGLIAVGIIRSLGDVTLSQGYRNAPWLFWIAGVCLPIWAVLKIISLLRKKAVLSTEESSQVFSNLNRVQSAVFSELSVPANAKEVDLFSFYYKIKNGKIKVCEKGFQFAPYLNPVYKVFADSEYLYIANLEGKYAIPLSSVTAIRTVKKHIRVVGWNKQTACNEGIYKQYKLTADQYGCIHCQKYHILEFRENSSIWGLWIPCYELPVFEAITGIKAQ